MARQGRFGRLPRKAPDLSGALVAMLQQFWNQQEANMVSAWKDGGEVDGKPVTDERLLQFWQDRRDSVQKDDPLWDYYDQQHSQYKFAIEESKVGLSYAQHKMTAREVANWYKGQAGDYAHNSEMYRTVMGQAAKFLDAAKAQARASNAAARQKAYVRMRDATYKDFLWPSGIIMNGLTSIFRKAGVLTGSVNQQSLEGNDLAGALGPGADLTSLSVATGSAEFWPIVLDAINTPGTAAHDYFYGSGGIIDLAKRQGLDISAPFDQTDIEALMKRHLDGLDKLIGVDKRFNDVAPSGEIDKLRGQQRDTVDFYQFVMTIDESNTYAQNRRLLDSVLTDPTADPFVQMTAYSAYFKSLKSLETQVGTQNPVFLASLYNEERILLGDTAGLNPTIAEDALSSPFTSSGLGPTGPEGFATQTAAHTNELRDTIQRVIDGQAVIRKNPDGTWEAVDYSALQAQYPSGYVVLPGKATTNVMEPVGTTTHSEGQQNVGPPTGADRLTPQATFTPQTVSFATVYGAVPIVAAAPSANRDPATGEYLGESPSSNQSTNIGLVAYVPDGDGNPNVPIYGIYSELGQIRWTTSNPFLPGSTLSQGLVTSGNGATSLVVTADPTRPGAITYYDDAGNPTTDPTLAKTVNFNPQTIIDPSMQRTANPNSFIDPGVAFMASTDAGRQEVATWTPDEVFASYRSSPWVNWTDPNQTTEFWRDIGAIKSAGQQGNAKLNSEWQFYQDVRRFRGGDVNTVWDAAIGMMQRQSLVASESAERIVTPGQAAVRPTGSPIATGIPDEVTIAGHTFAYNQWLQAQQFPGTALMPQGYTPPTGYRSYPGAQPDLGTNGPFGPYSQYVNQPTAPGAQPNIQLSGQIKVPGLPASAYRSPDAADRNLPPAPTPAYQPRPIAALPPNMPLPPAPGIPPSPPIPGVSPVPRPPHEIDPFGPPTH